MRNLLSGKRRLVLMAAVIAAVMLAGAGYRIYANAAAQKERAGRAAADKTSVVEVMPAARRDITPVLVFSAGLEPAWAADLSAKVDGRIAEVFVNEGDGVRKGMTIAVLDAGELAAQAMQADGNVMAARSGLEQAELDLRRAEMLSGQGAISAQAYDAARTKRDLALGQLRAAQGNAALLQERLRSASVVAPRDGVVIRRHVQSGAFTRTGAPIVTVADVGVLLAKATVGEAQVADLTVGMPVKVLIDALGDREVEGVISRISPVASQPARTFTAEVSVPNADGGIRSGMFARVEIAGRTLREVLAVPESALVLREDQKSIFVVNAANRVEQRILRVGHVGGGWAQVLDGLQPGERIVVAGQNKIRDGAQVEIAPTIGGGVQ